MYNHFIIVVFGSQSHLRSIKKYYSIYDSIVQPTSTNTDTGTGVLSNDSLMVRCIYFYCNNDSDVQVVRFTLHDFKT